MVLDEDGSRPIVKRALDLGINFIDTCDYYSDGQSELVLGRLLDGFVKRDEIVLATKVGNPMGKGPNARGYSRKHLFEAVDASLKRLGTDYIDLYQTHIWDPSTNLEEMIEAFDALVASGRVLYLGITDMPAWQFAKAVFSPEAARPRALRGRCRTTTIRSGARTSAS
jgi:aryl-alcohol dehydrogenase-like predicted oxidoreductase